MIRASQRGSQHNWHHWISEQVSTHRSHPRAIIDEPIFSPANYLKEMLFGVPQGSNVDDAFRECMIQEISHQGRGRVNATWFVDEFIRRNLGPQRFPRAPSAGLTAQPSGLTASPISMPVPEVYPRWRH